LCYEMLLNANQTTHNAGGIIRAFTVGLLSAAAVATLILVGTRSRHRSRSREAYRRALTRKQLRELGI
jgi:hypothetical protein